MDKKQKIRYDKWKRLEKQTLGKRKFEILMKIAESQKIITIPIDYSDKVRYNKSGKVYCERTRRCVSWVLVFRQKMIIPICFPD